MIFHIAVQHEYLFHAVIKYQTVAKKNIISDFGSLKGKVSFSEEKPAAVVTAEQAKDQPKTGSETVLKVGQKVVLMDSDLRGKIVSLGRTVGIELEDGFVIQAAYGEFAITDDREITALMQSKVKRGSAHVPVGKPAHSSSGLLSVDLHIEAIPGGSRIPKGQQLQFQMDTFRRIIRENLSHKGRKICFIHGVGDGILKSAIRKDLDEVLSLRCTYSVGDPAVTVVTIK